MGSDFTSRTSWHCYRPAHAPRVKSSGSNHIAIIAAWLHDVMEDCGDCGQIVKETLATLPHAERDEIFAIVAA